MMFDASTIQNFARISSRGVFSEALYGITPKHPELMVIVADVASSAKLNNFEDKYPDRIVNVGIAEQNMIGIGAGLASEGHTVFATTFGPFASMRCFEQLRTQLGYMNLNVKVVGLLSGVASGSSGNTHYGLEDLAITRTIPNMTILSPADCVETYKVIEAAANYCGPCYIRLTGVEGTPAVYKGDYNYEIGKGIVMQEGADIAIIATGTMVYECIRATRALKRHNIVPTVINMHTLKPLDTELLDNVFKNHKMIVTAEEHFKIGGLGSAVAEYKSVLENSPKHLIIGIEDKFEKAGSYSFMLNKCGLTAPKIADKILQHYHK